ncbi:MAG TPA: ComEC/Rec2 family competence protein [Thermomicrobiales bacterium]|nr:ComEC/Rec2 family competence protein [Thermomicrobiales bacterium]
MDAETARPPDRPTARLPPLAAVWLGGAWLAGVALGLAGADWWPAAGCGGAALLALAALYPERRRGLLWAALLVGALALGAGRAGLGRPTPADLPPGEIEAARGVVVAWPERGDRGDRLVVAVDQVRIAGRWQGGAARVSVDAPPYPPAWRGDRVEVVGAYRPVAAIELVGYRDALARRGLHGDFRAFGLRLLDAAPRDDVESRRAALLDWIGAALRRHVPQPEAALVAGLLLGDASLLPRATRDAFNATGTAHVMALSGWNIALVAGLCALVGRRLGRERAWYWLAGSAGVVWLYTVLVGGGPTLVRAAIMGTLYLLAGATGRRGDALTALVAAAVLMTALAPGALLDLGFQLSCAATAGLVLCSGRLAHALRRLPPFVAEGLAATVAAELFTLPLALHAFGRLSLVTLPANLLIEPLVPAVMLGGVATVAARALDGLATLPADLCGLAAWLPARGLLLVVERLGAPGWAAVTIAPPGWPVVAALYGALAAALDAPAWRPVAARLAARWWRALVGARPAVAPLACGAASGAVIVAWALLLAGS